MKASKRDFYYTTSWKSKGTQSISTARNKTKALKFPSIIASGKQTFRTLTETMFETLNKNFSSLDFFEF